jgi:hypothetical protein
VERQQYFLALTHFRRWEEELSLQRNKMQRVPRSFEFLARQWEARAVTPIPRSAGHTAYAERWRAFFLYQAASAAHAFQKLLLAYPPPAGVDLIFDQSFDLQPPNMQ